MKKTKLLFSVSLTVLLLTSFLSLSVFCVSVQTFTLPSFSATYLQYVIPEGTTFNGSISTTGSVRFFASDPNGSEIVNLGIIDKNASFGFLAQQTGKYTLNFENELPNSDVQVTFSFVTNPAIQSTNNSSGIPFVYVLTTIEIIVALAVLLIIFFMRRRQSKIKTVTSS